MLIYLYMLGDKFRRKLIFHSGIRSFVDIHRNENVNAFACLDRIVNYEELLIAFFGMAFFSPNLRIL